MEDGYNILDFESYDFDFYYYNEVDFNFVWYYFDLLDEVSMFCLIWDKKGGGDFLGWMEYKLVYLESLGLRKMRFVFCCEVLLWYLRYRESLIRDCWFLFENLEVQQSLRKICDGVLVLGEWIK